MRVPDADQLANAFSESQRIIHKNDVDSSGMPGKAGDQELAADGIRGFAVHARSRLRTGR
jgi:hypothetical protein